MDAEFGIGSLVEEDFKPKEKVYSNFELRDQIPVPCRDGSDFIANFRKQSVHI